MQDKLRVKSYKHPVFFMIIVANDHYIKYKQNIVQYEISVFEYTIKVKILLLLTKISSVMLF